jgi:hypothetical protein
MKRRLVQVFILLFALWPLLHFGLVVRYGVDPWKLFGWGMYSVPGAMKSLRLAVESDQGQLVVIDPETYSTREGRAALRFVEYRRALGRLARPDDLLQVFFEERPELQSIVVGLATLELDPDSGHLVSTLAYTHFDRDGRPIPFDPSK